MARRARLLLVAGLTLAVGAVILALPPIPQDQAYHHFADRRPCLAIANCLNVLSNAPFLVCGLLGLVVSLSGRSSATTGPFGERPERWAYGVLFAGVALTAVGSAYYHLAPGNGRLVWDRVPMSLGFMGLLAATIAERIGPRAGRLVLGPLVAVGVGSVVTWYVGELHGAGDLRLYLAVQFAPLLVFPLMALLFPPRYTRSTDLLGAMGCYLLAKLFELLDAPIFAMGRIVSGHTLKHLAAALAAYWILRMLRARAPRPTPGRLLKKAHMQGGAEREE